MLRGFIGARDLDTQLAKVLQKRLHGHSAQASSATQGERPILEQRRCQRRPNRRLSLGQ